MIQRSPDFQGDDGYSFPIPEGLKPREQPPTEQPPDTTGDPDPDAPRPGIGTEAEYILVIFIICFSLMLFMVFGGC